MPEIPAFVGMATKTGHDSRAKPLDKGATIDIVSLTNRLNTRGIYSFLIFIALFYFIRGLKMKISSRSEYACRALVELATNYPARKVLQLKDIAAAQAIPEKYLVHILLQLKQHGLVGSIRGANGGYYLQHSPAQISLGKVIRIVDGPILPLKDIPSDPKNNDFKTIWQDVRTAISDVVNNISFADILERIHDSGQDIYQI